MIYDGEVSIIEYTILGNLRIICRIQNGKIIKTTTTDGTELNIKGASDCLGYYDDQIMDVYHGSKEEGRSA